MHRRKQKKMMKNKGQKTKNKNKGRENKIRGEELLRMGKNHYLFFC